jgi:N-acetylglucosamine-6-sulfatase
MVPSSVGNGPARLDESRILAAPLAAAIVLAKIAVAIRARPATMGDVKFRRWLAVLVIVAAFAALRLRAPVAAASGAGARPDLIVFLLDDDTLSRVRFLNGARSGPQLLPAFRRLGIHSVYCSRVYASTPLCVPSRCTYLTGQYAQRHGVVNNQGGADSFTNRGLDGSTVATWLHDCGYRTMYFGKYLNLYGAITTRPRGFVPPGFTDWHAYTNLGRAGYWDFELSDDGVVTSYPRRTDADYGIDVLRDKAVSLIAAASSTQPLFVTFAPTSPHEPATPAPRYANDRPTLAAPRPPANPAWMEEDVSDKPAYIQAIPFPAPPDRVAEIDQLYRDGANCLSSVTDAILAIVDAVNAAGRLNRTVFVVTNDNGYSYLDHRLRGKTNPYESSVRVYIAFASANATLIPANRVERSLVCNVDLAPTLARLARAPIPAGHVVDGRNLVPLIRGQRTSVRTDALLGGYGPETDSDYPPWRAIVTGPEDALPNWKYVDYLDGHVELYDLAADAFEMASVSGDPARAATRSALAARLAALRTQ